MTTREPVHVQVCGPLTAGEAAPLAARIEQLWRDGEHVVCDLHGACDLGLVDALARVALSSRRLGTWLRVRVEAGDTEALLDLAGLASALHLETR